MNGARSTGSKSAKNDAPARSPADVPNGANVPPQASLEQLAPPFQIFVESKYAVVKDDVYENNCTFNLPPTYLPDFQAFRVTLKGFTIPVSWYIINSYNNTLQLTYDGVDYYDIVITEGNYSVKTFPAAFSAAIAAGAAGASITCALDTLTNKWTFTGGAPFTFRSIKLGTTMFPFLGFKAYPSNSITEYSSSFASGANTLTSKLPVDFSGNNSIYIETSFKTSNIGSDGATGKPSLSVIGRVPQPVNYTGILNIDPSGYQTCELGDRQISQLKIRLLDENFNVIQATLPWQMNIDVDFAWNPANRTFESSSRGATKRLKSDHNANFSAVDSRAQPTPVYLLPPAPEPNPTDAMDVETIDPMSLGTTDQELQDAANDAAPNDPLAEARAVSVRAAAQESLKLSERLRQRASETLRATEIDNLKRGRGTMEDALKYGMPMPIISLSTVDPFRARDALRTPTDLVVPSLPTESAAGPGVQNP